MNRLNEFIDNARWRIPFEWHVFTAKTELKISRVICALWGHRDEFIKTFDYFDFCFCRRCEQYIAYPILSPKRRAVMVNEIWNAIEECANEPTKAE